MHLSLRIYDCKYYYLLTRFLKELKTAFLPILNIIRIDTLRVHF